MANYKDIHGTNIETVASDPSNPVNGQVWYNSTDLVLKGFTSNPSGTWSTGTAVNTARGYAGSAGQRTAALVFGGGPPPAPTAIANTEQWNGTSWTETGDLNTKRAFVAGGGTYTSALASGGDQLTGVTESWAGSTWTSITSAPNGKPSQGAAGADNEELIIWGGTPPDTSNEYWNGSSWSEIADLNTSVKTGGSAGVSVTAALSYGGETGPNTVTGNTESWNGTSWTEVADLNDARRYMNNYSCGTYTSALAIGGEAPLGAKTESWNGTSWAETGDLNTAGGGIATGCANNGDGIGAGGRSGPGISTDVEEFIAPTTSTVTFTASQMAKKFKDFVPRPKPKKRPRRHKKNLNKQEKRMTKKYRRQGR